MKKVNVIFNKLRIFIEKGVYLFKKYRYNLISFNSKVSKDKTLYELSKDYSREEIDLILSQLSDEEIKLLRLRYGANLDRPKIGVNPTLSDECFSSSDEETIISDITASLKPTPVTTDKKYSEDKGVLFIKENPTAEERDAMVQDIIEEFSGPRRFRAYFFDKLNPDYFDVEYGDISVLMDITSSQISDDTTDYPFVRRSQGNKGGKHRTRRKFERRF